MGNGFSSFGRALLVLSLVTGLAANALADKRKPHQRIPGELIIKLKQVPAAGSRMQAAVVSSLEKVAGANGVLKFEPFMTDKRLHIVKLKNDAAVLKAIAALKNETSVAYAEPNYKIHALDAPNDAEFAKLWGIVNTGQTDDAGQVGIAGSDINVLPLWNRGITGSRNVVVAVIDTGVQWDHPDLMNNIWTNPGEAGALATDGLDNDGNGFIDDVHGWNFASKAAVPAYGHNNNSRDDHDHGSHCSGTIGGQGNNAIGVAGVNWNVSILPVKFLDDQGGGSLAGAVEAINYATRMHVNIMSNSWGGGGFEQSLLDAIRAARDAGILFVAAAGNDGTDNDATPSYPASYDSDNIISVAATDNKDSIASFSNYGKAKVHVAAPGVKVYSTAKGGMYKTFSGTSMATPHVAGISALLLSANPTWDYRMIKQRLITTSTPVRGLKRLVVAKGRVNATNAMNNVIPPTNEPDERLWRDASQTIESAHPYAANLNQTFEVNSAGARYIRVHFTSVDLEQGYDKVTIKDANGVIVDTITGAKSNYTTEYVEGSKLIITFTTDGSVQNTGWVIDKAQIINQAPPAGRGRPDELVGN